MTVRRPVFDYCETGAHVPDVYGPFKKVVSVAALKGEFLQAPAPKGERGVREVCGGKGVLDPMMVSFWGPAFVAQIEEQFFGVVVVEAVAMLAPRPKTRKAEVVELTLPAVVAPEVGVAVAQVFAKVKAVVGEEGVDGILGDSGGEKNVKGVVVVEAVAKFVHRPKTRKAKDGEQLK